MLASALIQPSPSALPPLLNKIARGKRGRRTGDGTRGTTETNPQLSKFTTPRGITDTRELLGLNPVETIRRWSTPSQVSADYHPVRSWLNSDEKCSSFILE